MISFSDIWIRFVILRPYTHTC